MVFLLLFISIVVRKSRKAHDKIIDPCYSIFLYAFLLKKL